MAIITIREDLVSALRQTACGIPEEQLSGFISEIVVPDMLQKGLVRWDKRENGCWVLKPTKRFFESE